MNVIKRRPHTYGTKTLREGQVYKSPLENQRCFLVNTRRKVHAHAEAFDDSTVLELELGTSIVTNEGRAGEDLQHGMLYSSTKF